MVTVIRLDWPGKVSVLGLVILDTTGDVPALNTNVAVTGAWLITPEPTASIPPAGMIFTQSAAPVAVTSKINPQLPPPANSADTSAHAIAVGWQTRARSRSNHAEEHR